MDYANKHQIRSKAFLALNFVRGVSLWASSFLMEPFIFSLLEMHIKMHIRWFHLGGGWLGFGNDSRDPTPPWDRACTILHTNVHTELGVGLRYEIKIHI